MLEKRVIDVTNMSEIYSSTSKGIQRKYSNGEIWVKKGLEYQLTNWKDYLVELIAVEIANQLGIPVLQQGLAVIKNGKKQDLGCWSYNFLPPGYVFLSIYRILTKQGVYAEYLRMCEGQDTRYKIDLLISMIKKYTGLNITRYIENMIVLDFLVGNEDRHWNNIGVLFNAELNTYMIAPIFDNGRGLFEHDDKYYDLTLTKAINRMSGKPFSRSLRKAVKRVDTQYYRGRRVVIQRKMIPNALALRYLKYSTDKLGIILVIV